MDPEHFRIYVIRPTLERIALWSQSAENLLLGTALTESGGLKWLHQLGGGPALGLYQMEPATHDDHWQNFLAYRPGLRERVESVLAPGDKLDQLMTNLAYATAMARVHYLRDPEPLPAADDIEAMAHYWKRVYNTEAGAGTVGKFVMDARSAFA